MEIKESLPIGTILDSGVRKYEIKSVLGKGGFGITYLATSTIYVDNIPLDGQFAIKEHYISSMNERQGASVSISNVNNTEEIKESIDSFLVEAKRLNKLSLNHNGLVRVNESFRANGTAYYVMEYIKGQSLRDYVKHSPQGKLGEAEALLLFRPIAETIGYLHDNMVTHLDIKPDNILIRENGEPVVIDFGLSKHYSAKGTPTSTIKAAGCSAGYSPMEQYAGITTFSPEADVYALGATLLYMLTGKDPRIATDIKSDYVTNMLSGVVSDSFVSSISHAMAKLAEERTPSVLAFISELIGCDYDNSIGGFSLQGDDDENKTKKLRRGTPKEKKGDGYTVNNPMEALKVAFIRMLDFEGRSSRSEFWWSIPFLVVICFVCFFESFSLSDNSSYLGRGCIAMFLLFLIFIMSSICARRLNDAGFSNGLVLIPITLFYYITFCNGTSWYELFTWFWFYNYMIAFFYLASFIILMICLKKSTKQPAGKFLLSSKFFLILFFLLTSCFVVFFVDLLRYG